MATESPSLFSPGSWSEGSRIAAVLRKETVGGALLLLATVIAMVWANSPWSDSYFQLLDVEVGPAALHLNLTLATWAADGLLAIFFFVAGLELKREFVAGDLRDPKRAVVPVAAAVGGMIVPALVYLAIAGRHRPQGLGDPDRDRHRFRARRSRGDLHPPADLVAHLPAHPGRGRRSAGDHRHRAVLFQGPAPAVDVAGAAAAGRLRGAGAARHQPLVPVAAVGVCHLGAGACIRDPRHRRRGAARLHGAGATVRQGRSDPKATRAGRALRASGPAGVGGFRGPGVRVLLRRGDARRDGRTEVGADRSDRDRHHRRAGGRASRSAS